MVLVVATYGNTGCTRKVSQKFHQKQPSATLVSPHQMSLGQDVSLHCANQVVLRCTRLEGDFGVDRIQFEKITVRPAGGRTRTAVSNALEVVDALSGPVGQGLGVGNLLGEFRRGRGKSVKHP